jgi:hypothetical protein
MVKLIISKVFELLHFKYQTAPHVCQFASLTLVIFDIHLRVQKFPPPPPPKNKLDIVPHAPLPTSPRPLPLITK